jgi:hypothetical protein
MLHTLLWFLQHRTVANLAMFLLASLYNIRDLFCLNRGHCSNYVFFHGKALESGIISSVSSFIKTYFSYSFFDVSPSNYSPLVSLSFI